MITVTPRQRAALEAVRKRNTASLNRLRFMTTGPYPTHPAARAIHAEFRQQIAALESQQIAISEMIDYRADSVGYFRLRGLMAPPVITRPKQATLENLLYQEKTAICMHSMCSGYAGMQTEAALKNIRLQIESLRESSMPISPPYFDDKGFPPDVIRPKPEV